MFAKRFSLFTIVVIHFKVEMESRKLRVKEICSLYLQNEKDAPTTIPTDPNKVDRKIQFRYSSSSLREMFDIVRSQYGLFQLCLSLEPLGSSVNDVTLV